MHFAFTINAVTGTDECYVNGEYRASLSRSLETMYPLEAGGVLTIGQEQNDLAGGFDPLKTADGMIDELRVWPYIRTAAEIQGELHHRRRPNSTSAIIPPRRRFILINSAVITAAAAAAATCTAATA